MRFQRPYPSTIERHWPNLRQTAIRRQSSSLLAKSPKPQWLKCGTCRASRKCTKSKATLATSLMFLSPLRLVSLPCPQLTVLGACTITNKARLCCTCVIRERSLLCSSTPMGSSWQLDSHRALSRYTTSETCSWLKSLRGLPQQPSHSSNSRTKASSWPQPGRDKTLAASTVSTKDSLSLKLDRKDRL